MPDMVKDSDMLNSDSEELDMVLVLLSQDKVLVFV